MRAETCGRLLLQRASEPYRAASPFAYWFARGKLRGDPAFRAMLERGWLTHSRRILDLGCGQGLLFAWLGAARDSYERGDWPADWPEPPRCERLVGIELMSDETLRAQQALGPVAEFVQADLRDAVLAPADTVVVLDVLHYLEPQQQVALLARMRAALPAGGLLLLRVGDASAGLRFHVSQWVDRAVLLARGHDSTRTYCRSLADWRRVLAEAGFSSESVPLSHGTPFANVLLHARAT